VSDEDKELLQGHKSSGDAELSKKKKKTLHNFQC
jgi:hypothetical protein